MPKKIPTPKKGACEYIEKISETVNSIYFQPTDQNEIKRIISQLPNKGSSGYDNISNKLLKCINDEISKPLCELFNASLEQGIFPSNMKLSEVILLHKGKSRDAAENYRPTSLLITISKVLEKLVYKRVYSFLDSNGSLYTSQYGFRSNHSTDNVVTELLGEVLKNLENKRYTLAIFLDLSKAFDTLEHEVVIKKLARYGIRGTCQEWFKSYLSNRTMRLKCRTSLNPEEVKSKTYDVNYGTPQGSCLGPLIFLIFCNDLHLHMEHTKCIQFADDTTIYLGSKNLNYLKYCIEQDLCILQDWFNANKLTLNLEKTVGMLFNPNQNHHNDNHIRIELNSKILPMVKSIKFLGTWIDNTLNWKTHLEKLSLRITSRNGLLRRGKNLLNSHALKVLYYAQIHSLIQYGIVLWGNMINKSQLKKLQKLQNISVRQIDSRKHTDEIFRVHGIPKVQQLITLENVKLWHKQQLNTLPSRIQQIMPEDHGKSTLLRNHKYKTRNKGVPKLPKAKTVHYQKSLFIKGLSDYQNLPLTVRNLKNCRQFTLKAKGILCETE